MCCPVITDQIVELFQSSLVHSRPEDFVCHKDTAQDTQSPFVETFLAFCCVFMWSSDLDYSTFISSSQNLSFPHSIHLFRQNFQWLLQQHSTTSQTSGEVDGESLSLKRIWTISWILWAVLLLKILFKGQEIKITSLPRQFIENWDNFSSCWKRQFLLGSFLTYFSILYKMIIKIQTANCNF